MDWSIIFYWLMATTMGWLLGWLGLPAIAVIMAGIGAGVMQCVVLYRRLPRAWHWAVATTVGWLAGAGLALVTVPPGIGLLSGAVIGAMTGIAQYSLLRLHVHWAGWWIPISILAWATALALAPASGEVALPPIVLSGAMAASMTGIPLVLLLRNPKKHGPQAQSNGATL